MLFWLPCRLRSGIPAPLDQITKFLLVTNKLVPENVLDLIFGFSVDKFRKRQLRRNSVLGGNDLWSEQ